MRTIPLVFIGICLVFSTQTKAQNIPKWKIEDVVNSFSRKTDSVYVVNFWGTFCRPCVEEMPFLQSISDKYKAQKVKLLLVSLDLPGYYPDKIAAFALKNNIHEDIVWLDEDDANRFCPPIDKKWIGDMPATIFVNAKTGYKAFFQEELTPEKFEAELQKAITGTLTN
ncbi:MAG TPA: TlpA disulfide reductase family protein [Ferruginibacter sp.]|nr:TlpA disulfide reductase family protein [Ferruginibacter sp.]